jgi:sigma-B regulation protein RsbU (phosphoserine phosphatase)
MTAAAGDGFPISPSADTGVRARVLIADDHQQFRSLLRAILLEAGMEVLDAEDGEGVLSLVADQPPDAIVIDWLMPGGGLPLVHELIDGHGMDGRVVMLSALNDRRDVLSAVRAGVTRYLIKPLNAGQLLAALADIAAGETPDERVER